MIVAQKYGFKQLLRMLPKQLLNLVHNYKEDGILVQINGIVWWFNGKRFEYWLKGDFNIYLNTPYTNGTLFVYQEKKWKPLILADKWNDPWKLVHNPHFFFQILVGKFIYREAWGEMFEKFDGVRSCKLNFKQEPRAGCKVVSDNNYMIYYFGSQVHEKFCTITETWSYISSYYTIGYDKFHFFNGKCYCFKDKQNYIVYDCESDAWSKIASS